MSGEPQGMGYCHCSSCRSWSAAPVTAFSLWSPGAIRVVSGEQLIGTFSKTEMSKRQYCTKCGGHLMTNHPPLRLVDVYAATIPTLSFKPELHVNYGEKVMSFLDGLAKFRDFPAPMGGSGQMLPE